MQIHPFKCNIISSDGTWTPLVMHTPLSGPLKKLYIYVALWRLTFWEHHFALLRLYWLCQPNVNKSSELLRLRISRCCWTLFTQADAALSFKLCNIYELRNQTECLLFVWLKCRIQVWQIKQTEIRKRKEEDLTFVWPRSGPGLQRGQQKGGGMRREDGTFSFSVLFYFLFSLLVYLLSCSCCSSCSCSMFCSTSCSGSSCRPCSSPSQSSCSSPSLLELRKSPVFSPRAIWDKD